MITNKEMLLDPATFFSTPDEVIRHDELSVAEKVEILKRWAYDITELSVATEENMPSGNDGEADELQKIHHLLIHLGAKSDEATMHSNKHG